MDICAIARRENILLQYLFIARAPSVALSGIYRAELEIGRIREAGWCFFPLACDQVTRGEYLIFVASSNPFPLLCRCAYQNFPLTKFEIVKGEFVDGAHGGAPDAAPDSLVNRKPS